MPDAWFVNQRVVRFHVRISVSYAGWTKREIIHLDGVVKLGQQRRNINRVKIQDAMVDGVIPTLIDMRQRVFKPIAHPWRLVIFVRVVMNIPIIVGTVSDFLRTPHLLLQ